MSEWKEYNFLDVADFKKGINYFSSDYSKDKSGIPFISIKCLMKGGGFDYTGIKFLNDRFDDIDKVKTGDLLFAITDLTRDGDIVGSPLLVPSKYSHAVASMDLVLVKCKELFIDTKFLYFLMMTKEFRSYFINHSAGSTVLHLEIASIPILKLKLPSQAEQRRIASILSTCDAVIEKTQAAIDKYKAIKQGMLYDLFTRGIDITTGKLRPKYEDAPELYKESKLGMVPKEWKVDTLGKVCDVTSSKRIYMNEYVDFGIPFYRSLEIILKSNDQEIGTTLYISDDRYEDIEKQFGVPKHGDILITSVGTLGISYRVKENDLFYFKDGNLIWFRNFSDIEYSRFLLHSLDELIRLQFDGITIGTSQKAFTIDKLKKLNIILPKENEYKIISQRIEVFNNQLQIEQACLRKLQSIKQGLMADLLSGRKRVSVPEEVLDVAKH